MQQDEHSEGSSNRKLDQIRNRYNKDIELYHGEIEEITGKIKNEEDPCQKRQLERMLLETRRALADVLNKMENLC
jgi:hypothetical protein